METWTDERLDDLAATLRPLPAEVARLSAEVRSVTEETRAFRQEMREDMRALRSDFAHIGWGLVATLVAAVVVLIVALA